MEAPIPGVSIGLMGYGMVMVEVIVREMLGMSCCCCCCFCVECRKMSPVVTSAEVVVEREEDRRSRQERLLV